MIYESEFAYIESCTTLTAQIVAIDALIAALIITAAKAARRDHLDEYWLNDGQTQIKAIYRSTKEVNASILAMEQLRSRLIGRKHGRITRLVDSKNFPHGF